MSRDETGRARQRIRTMAEFSAASGISRPTLSRFFNDPQSVRPASRARINDAMQRFGYRPNLFALNFNRRNPKTLGILVPSLMDPFYAGLVQRIEKLALDAGYWTIILNARGSAESEAQAVMTLTSLKIAGAVVIPLGQGSSAALFKDLGHAMPLIFLDARFDDRGAFVGTDNAQSMGLIVDYLIRSGSPPCYFDMPEVNQNARERRLAYLRTMASYGLEPRVISIASLDWDFERVAFEEASRVFRSGPLACDTIQCANDRIAFGVMAAASQCGYTIGRAGELRIAGHDDHPLSQYACPPLTTVAQDYEGLATVSLGLLLSAIGPGPRHVIGRRLDGKLVMRASA